MQASKKIQVHQNNNATSKNISIKWTRDMSNRIKMRHVPICLCRSRMKKARESKAQSFQAVEPRPKLRKRLILHQFCMTLLSERGESNKTNANKVSYGAPLTRKTRLNTFSTIRSFLVQLLVHKLKVVVVGSLVVKTA